MEKLEGLKKVGRMYKTKVIKGWLWIKIFDGLHLLEFDAITRSQFNEGKRIISFIKDGNSIIVFNENQLKGKLRVAKVDDDLIQYDLF